MSPVRGGEGRREHDHQSDDTQRDEHEASLSHPARRETTQVDSDTERSDEAVVYFWIRKSRLPYELDRRLLDEIGHWLAGARDIDRHLVVTAERFEQQVAMIESTDLRLEFRIVDPEKPGRDLAYA
jgi:hypothetical protein